MSNLPTLNSDNRDIHHIYNPDTQSYDVICLKTGDIIDSVNPRNLTPYRTQYSLLKADQICQMLIEGKTLKQICSMPDMPSSARIYHWLAMHPEFKQRYEEARKQRAEYFHDEAIHIATQPLMKDEVPGAKLAVETLKWAAEKNDPHRFGKKDTVEHTGQAINITLQTGVLDTPRPTDIIVDEYGNFKGFDDGTESQVDVDTQGRSGSDGGVIELNTDRWRTFESGEGREASQETEEG